MRIRVPAVLAISALIGAAGQSTGWATGAAAGRPRSARPAQTTPTNCPSINQPGVTSTEIRVGGVTSKTNPLGGLYDNAFQGVQAYFNMVNSQGGVFCRKLVITSQRDDQIGNNKSEIDSLINQDSVFVAMPIATILSFSGSPDLTRAGVPGYGWAINDQWYPASNLYGHSGAYCNGASCVPDTAIPYLAHRLHKHHLGVLAYSVANSAQCADGIKKSFSRYGKDAGADVAFLDESLQFGVTDVSADVQHMVDKHVDFVATCMDQNGTLTLAREMQKQGLHAIQYMPNAYDQAFIAKYGNFFEGSYVLVQEAPLETKPAPPGMVSYVKWMNKAGYRKVENAEVGWVNADQFVTGLKLAGPDFTRQKIIDALNTNATPFSAGGLIPPIDWRTQHSDVHHVPFCGALVKVHNSKFDAAPFHNPGKPFICRTPEQPKSLSNLQVTFLS